MGLMSRGQLITFEGIDGSGKSTQIKLLPGALIAGGLDPVVTREPGGTIVGERVREMLLASADLSLASVAELLLYAADRSQHVADVIRPCIDAGRRVLCDRYIDSTVAIQGFGRRINLATIGDLNRIATGGLIPDLTNFARSGPAGRPWQT
jgi:dTMP kinase